MRQHKLDLMYTATQNCDIFGSIADISRSKPSSALDLQNLSYTVSASVISSIRESDKKSLCVDLMHCFPIGFPDDDLVRYYI